MQINEIEKTRLELKRQGRKILDLSSGIVTEPSMQFPVSVLEKSFRSFLKKPLYQADSKGFLKARLAVADWYHKRGVSMDPKNILLTSGTSESYFEIFSLVAKPGEEILIPHPTYPLLSQIAEMAHIKTTWYPLNESSSWEPDLKKLESTINPRTRAIVLISPNNPTGSVLSETSLKGIAKIAQKYHLPLISDEVFSELVFDGKTYPRAAMIARECTVFTLNGLSKTYALPGLKLSWIAVTGPEKERWGEELSYKTDVFLACNQISQEMLPEILQHGEKFQKKYLAYLQKNREIACRILTPTAKISRSKTAEEIKKPVLSFHVPEAGPYLFLKIEGLPLDDEQLVIALLKKTGIFVHPGYFYDDEESLHVLISLVHEPRKLEKALKKFRKNLENFHLD